jgi:ribose 5-phosphate isomerase RpiB
MAALSRMFASKPITCCGKPRRRSHDARRNRGIALCGSGVGASIAANKVFGVRAGRIHDVSSAHQGVKAAETKKVA